MGALNKDHFFAGYSALSTNAGANLIPGQPAAYLPRRLSRVPNSAGLVRAIRSAAPAQTTADVAFQSYVYNVHLDYGLCYGDVTHAFNGYVNYDLPFGHGRSFGRNVSKAVNAVVGDSRYDSIVTAHGRLPISMIQFGNDPSGAYFQPRPDCLAPPLRIRISRPAVSYGSTHSPWRSRVRAHSAIAQSQASAAQGSHI